MKQISKLISFSLIIIFMFSLGSLKILAGSCDYIIDDGERIPIPKTYVLKDIIYNVENEEDIISFKNPEDIFINEQGYIYVVDTGNNCITKLNKEGKLISVFKEADGKAFNSPMGVFVDNKGNLYVADTWNRRIVHLSDTGEFVESFIRPESSFLSETFTFEPTKLCVTPTGYIYVLKGENILTLDAFNNFRGYMGQSDIGYSFTDAILRIFASDEQRSVVRKRTAATYINMTMDEKGMIYAVTMDITSGEIKKLNSIGNNIYRKYTTMQESANLFNLDFLTSLQLASRSFIFGERSDDKGNPITPLFKDIVVDKNGIVTVLEERTGKLYQYDQEGNLITVFGGKGDQRGYFSSPVALDVDDNGNIYVLDRVLENIQVFEPTDFILKVQEGVNLYLEGEYDKAYIVWEDVLEIHENYPLARLGLAKALFKQKKWKESMDQYKEADNREGYSKAFIKYRYEIFREKFVYVLILLIIVVTVNILILKLIHKLAEDGVEKCCNAGEKQLRIIDILKLSFGVLTHPIDTFEVLKNKRDRMNAIPGVIILVFVFLARIFYIFNVHYPLADIDLQNCNITLEAVKILLPVITWVIASFAITAILEGESKLKDIFLASSFSMMPYILITFPLAIISNLLSRNEAALFAIILNATWIWILLLFIIQVKTLNDYRVGKTITVCVISSLSMALIWAIGLMTYVATAKLYRFLEGIMLEVKMVIN